MEVVQNKENLSSILTVKISQGDYATNVEKELKKARQTAQIKGFRPGNAPMSIVKRMYEQSILVDKINELLQKSLTEFQEKEERQIIGEIIPCDEKQPLINWESQKDFEFVYEVGFYPEFNYQLTDDTEVIYYNITPDADEMDGEMTYFRKQHGKIEDVDSVEGEDYVKVDVKLVKDEEEKNHSTGFLMTVIPEEYKSLFLGAKVDDEINVEIHKVFTNETDLLSMLGLTKEELDMQAETLPFEIKGITRVGLAEINQEFFDKIAGEDKVHNEEELKAYMADQAKEYYDKLSLNRLYVDSEEVLLEKADITLPDEFLKRLLVFLNRDKDDVTEEQIDNAFPYLIKDFKWKYIVDSILKQENFEITNEAVMEEAKNVVLDRLRRYGISDISQLNINIEQLVTHTLQNEEEINGIISNLKADKLARIIKEKVKLDVKDVDIKEFNKLYQDENESASEIEETAEIETAE